MTELLIGMVIGVVVCWAVLHVTEWHFERRNS
jgi:hypothetical protein